MRFDRAARRLVRHAEKVARDLGSDRVGAEHLLVACLQERGGGGAALGEAVGRVLEAREADALATLGISLQAVRRRVEETLGPEVWGEAGLPRRMPFTHEAKAALVLSLREAAGLRHPRILPGHVLLGLLDQQGSAWAALVAAGGSVQELRAAVLAELGSPAM